MGKNKIFLVTVVSIIVFILSLNWLSIFKLYKVSLNLNIENYKEIKVERYGIIYYLPVNFEHIEINFEDNEVLYHADFKSSDGSIRGIVEVLNIKDLETYLENSKKSATGVVDFKFFNIYNKKVANKDGYLLEYVRRGNDNKYYRVYEYFVKTNKGYVFRMSFFIRDEIFNDKFYNLFEEIVNKTLIK
ncbi:MULTISPECIES: hypothetical protein [Caloramator]|uniref:PsbP protein n=1 Tax=Caloramator proteoclasticus DSM 10124 TaxID=1121262 RepID=A0A1M4UKQ6_9CLOT|nr:MULTISPECIES: hypothetical protein [Caloramator]SHE57238.1 hypothetical protein SAMN02746091_00676 [Caloramator proteoclasticus DSM 10124]